MSSSRSNVKIMPGAIVCEESKLRGDISIGSGTIIHPSASINAVAGPIIIGDNCLIEEQCEITYRTPINYKESNNDKPLKIGNHNVFEVGAVVEAAEVGDNNVFESKCFVGPKVTIMNGCIVGAGCRLTDDMILKENAVIYGSKCCEREALDKPGLQVLQMDTLSKVLPNYHRLLKPNKKVESRDKL